MLESLFQNTTQQILSKYNPQLQQINLIGNTFKTLTDNELQEKTRFYQAGTSEMYGKVLEIPQNEKIAVPR